MPTAAQNFDFALPASVVITGIAGNLGRVLAKLLHTGTRLFGIDRRGFDDRPKDIVHYPVDVRKKRAEDLFRRHRIEAVIHMGIMHDPRMPHAEAHNFNVIGTHLMLERCVRYGVKKLVVLSSANAYGPSPDNSNFLSEEAPLLAAQRFSNVRDLVELDMFAQSFVWRHPEVETVILRPVHIVGPTVKNAPSNYLRLVRPVTVMGFDPMLQLIHEEDACQAMVAALRPGTRGVFNITGPGEVPLSKVLSELGRKSIPVPNSLLRAAITQAFNSGLVSFPPEEVDHLQYLCAVDGSRASRELGFSPRYSMRETIRSVLPPHAQLQVG